MSDPVGWGCRIHQLHLYNVSPGYDTKLSDVEAPVIFELWGMLNSHLLPSLPGLRWPGVEGPEEALSMSQIEIICVLMLNWIVWNKIAFDI